MIFLNNIIDNILQIKGARVADLGEESYKRLFETNKNSLKCLKHELNNDIKAITDPALIKYVDSKDKYLFYKRNGRWFFVLKDELISSLVEKTKYCPYCGQTVIKKIPNMRETKLRYNFELDHFFPKSKFPHLGLDPYNLIWVCSDCNRMKGSKNFEDDGFYFHPYMGRFYAKDNRYVLQNSNFDNKSFSELFNYSKFEYNEIAGMGLTRKTILYPNYTNQLLRHIHHFYLEHLYVNEEVAMDHRDYLNKKSIVDEKKKITIPEDPHLSIESIIENAFKDRYPKSIDQILTIKHGKMRKDLVEKLKKDLNL